MNYFFHFYQFLPKRKPKPKHLKILKFYFWKKLVPSLFYSPSKPVSLDSGHFAFWADFIEVLFPCETVANNSVAINIPYFLSSTVLSSSIFSVHLKEQEWNSIKVELMDKAQLTDILITMDSLSLPARWPPLGLKRSMEYIVNSLKSDSQNLRDFQIFIFLPPIFHFNIK